MPIYLLSAIGWRLKRATKIKLTSSALSFHVAVVAPDARAERRRLEAAGATFQSEDVFPDGTCLVMLRDPWGVSLQLCQRARPFA